MKWKWSPGHWKKIFSIELNLNSKKRIANNLRWCRFFHHLPFFPVFFVLCTQNDCKRIDACFSLRWPSTCVSHAVNKTALFARVVVCIECGCSFVQVTLTDGIQNWHEVGSLTMRFQFVCCECFLAYWNSVDAFAISEKKRIPKWIETTIIPCSNLDEWKVELSHLLYENHFCP